MPSIDVYNIEGKKVKSVDLKEEILITNKILFITLFTYILLIQFNFFNFSRRVI